MVKIVFLAFISFFIVGCSSAEKHSSSFIITLENNGTKAIEDFCLGFNNEKKCINLLKPNTQKMFKIYLNGETSLSISYKINKNIIYSNEDISCYCDSSMKGYVNIMINNNIIYVGNITTYLLNKPFDNIKKYDSIITPKNGLKWIK